MAAAHTDWIDDFAAAEAGIHRPGGRRMGVAGGFAQLGDAGGYFGWILKYGKRFWSKFDYYLMVL